MTGLLEQLHAGPERLRRDGLLVDVQRRRHRLVTEQRLRDRVVSAGRLDDCGRRTSPASV